MLRSMYGQDPRFEKIMSCLLMRFLELYFGKPNMDMEFTDSDRVRNFMIAAPDFDGLVDGHITGMNDKLETVQVEWVEIIRMKASGLYRLLADEKYYYTLDELSNGIIMRMLSVYEDGNADYLAGYADNYHKLSIVPDLLDTSLLEHGKDDESFIDECFDAIESKYQNYETTCDFKPLINVPDKNHKWGSVPDPVLLHEIEEFAKEEYDNGCSEGMELLLDKIDEEDYKEGMEDDPEFQEKIDITGKLYANYVYCFLRWFPDLDKALDNAFELDLPYDEDSAGPFRIYEDVPEECIDTAKNICNLFNLLEIVAGDIDYEFVLPRLKDMYKQQGNYAKLSELTRMTEGFDELVNPEGYMSKESVDEELGE